METQITFTFGQLLACIGTVCGTITGIAAAVAVLSKAVHKAREPNTVQDQRIAALAPKTRQCARRQC